MEMGKITPAFKDGEETREWRVPVSVMMMPQTRELKVISVYEDEGFLCIDVEEITES